MHLKIELADYYTELNVVHTDSQIKTHPPTS